METSGITDILSEGILWLVEESKDTAYIINAENLPPVFYELGVAGADGKILRAKFDKFRQICRFFHGTNSN